MSESLSSLLTKEWLFNCHSFMRMWLEIVQCKYCVTQPQEKTHSLCDCVMVTPLPPPPLFPFNPFDALQAASPHHIPSSTSFISIGGCKLQLLGDSQLKANCKWLFENVVPVIYGSATPSTRHVSTAVHQPITGSTLPSIHHPIIGSDPPVNVHDSWGNP